MGKLRRELIQFHTGLTLPNWLYSIHILAGIPLTFPKLAFNCGVCYKGRKNWEKIRIGVAQMSMALKPINKENFFAQNPTFPIYYLFDFFIDFRISSKDALLLFLPNLYCLTMKPQHFCSSEFGRNKMCYIINLWLALMKGREVQGTV